jgi:hypothetical protein
MACGCKPTVTPGTCNRTIELCRYSPLTVLAVNPVCTALPYNLTVVGAIGNIIYSIVNDGKSIAINSDETTDELAYITYEYNCNGIPQTCTLTINVQDRIEGTHAIELNACSSTCSLGDTTYLWTGFTDGCVELMPGYSATDCQIKVLVYEECEENLNNVISLEVCCGACLDGCCKTTTWTWNPPTFNDNCDADCTMYPCTVYDPVTGNCVSSCEHCETCCGGNAADNTSILMTCIKMDEQNYTIDLNTNRLDGQWILASTEDVAEGDNCLLVTDYQIFDTSIINNGINGGMDFIYFDNGHMQITITTDDIPDEGGTVFVGYKVGDCKKYYAFQILALADQTPINHCLGTFVFNEYLLEHNLLVDGHYPLCNTCTPSDYYCADCCDNSGCVKENCTNQPVCSSGECKCFIGQLEVPALPNGCCPAECTEDTIIPTCSTCVSGVIIPAPVCTETFVLNTNTCLCECPSGTVFDALTMTCIQVNCNVPGQTCPPCHNCVEGVCTPISCSGVPGMVNNPIGDGTVQNPCCIPDPCPNCIASLEVNKYCTDVLPRRANVSADATNYRIKFTQIQLNYLPLYSQVNCEYEALQAITQTNNLVSGVTYQINYTNYILDWVTITPSGTTLIIPQSAGNGFLIKCSWKGREVIYEFIFEEGFNGSADQLVLGEYPIQVRKVKDLTCGNVYGLSGDCQTTYSWEFTEAALNTSGQFITDNPIVVHATGLDAEVCVNAVTQFNGIVCEETQVCADVDECQGACGCDPCNGGGTLFSTISQVTASDTLIFYASVFRDCGNGDELPIMFTCAPPTNTEFAAYEVSSLDLPDACGTLPQMFASRLDFTCANCATFTCAVPAEADPATQLCGWWVDTTKLVDDTLITLNGANIEFSIKPNIPSVELCFGVDTDCGYACNCTTVINPTFNPACIMSAVVDLECYVIGRIESVGITVSNAILPYTVVYDINIIDEFDESFEVLPTYPGTITVTNINTSAYIITPDPIVMGDDGCLDYTITITDSSVPPCIVTLTGCQTCRVECTEDSPQWIQDTVPPQCCEGDLVYCAGADICVELPEDCTYGTWDPNTCNCPEAPLACLGVLITRDENDYTVTSIGSQSFVGATYLWSVVSGPGTFVTATTLQTVTISNTAASTVIRAVVTFLDDTVCTATINGSTCVEGATSVDLDVVVSTDHPDFEVTATLVSNTGLLANYSYQLVDPNLNFGEYFISTDGTTYTTLSIINSGVLTITQANYNIFVKYVVSGYGYIIKNISINPFNGDVNTLSVTNVQFSSTTNTATLTVVGTSFLDAEWVVSGDIVIISGQGTNEIEWLGCNGTITAVVFTTCGSLSAEEVDIEGCGLYPCTPPTMTFELTPAYEGATSIFAVMPNVVWNNNTPTNITWTEVDPNSAITLTDNGLWALLSVDTSLIVDPTSVSVLIETDCGDLTDEIVFDECTILYEIQTCQMQGVGAIGMGSEYAVADYFIAIHINGTPFAPPSPIPIADNGDAAIDIQAYLDTLVPIVGGIFFVVINVGHGSPIITILWASCNATTLTFTTIKGGDTSTIVGTPQSIDPPLTYATVLWSNPQQPPTSFLWALGVGLTLESGYTATDQTIVFSGDGDLDVTVETADCGDIIPPTITVDPLCEVRLNNHAQTRVAIGGTGSLLTTDLYIAYLGTGSMIAPGLTVTIDWGDGTIITTPFVQNSTVLGPSMKISHTYASGILRYTIVVTGTDSNSLSFSHTKVMSFNTTAGGPRDSYAEFFYIHNSIIDMNLSCCGACSQRWDTVRYSLDPLNITLGADMVDSETLRVQGSDNVIVPVEPLNAVKHNTITTTLNSTPGTYAVRYRTVLINSTTLVPYYVQSLFQFTTI